MILRDIVRLPRSLNTFANKLSSSASNVEKLKTAAVIGLLDVIGDEILKGDVHDTNSHLITKEMYNLGVKVKKISIIGDDLEEISNEVKLFSVTYDYVITSGGIGPTHDDITFEAVAAAFEEPLVLNPELKKLCEWFFKTSDINHPGMKLARIPKSSKLTFGDNTNYPNVSVGNVYIFPGVPELLMKSFKSLAPKLFKSETNFYMRSIYLNVTEDQISQRLEDVVREFPEVQFGSYPKLFHDSYKVKITIESTNEQTTLTACNMLLQSLPRECIVAVN